MKSRIMLALGLMGLLAAGSGIAGQWTGQSLKANIDFQFTAGTTVLPAGMYEFTADSTAPLFRIQGEGKNSALVTVITRLSEAMHTTPQDAHLVFDVVGSKSTLSEIWIPGSDGYVLAVTKGKHEHKVINIQR